MRKYTLRELRELVRLGMAVNITEADPKSTDIYKAIQSQVMKEVEDMKR